MENPVVSEKIRAARAALAARHLEEVAENEREQGDRRRALARRACEELSDELQGAGEPNPDVAEVPNPPYPLYPGAVAVVAGIPVYATVHQDQLRFAVIRGEWSVLDDRGYFCQTFERPKDGRGYLVDAGEVAVASLEALSALHGDFLDPRELTQHPQDEDHLVREADLPLIAELLEESERAAAERAQAKAQATEDQALATVMSRPLAEVPFHHFAAALLLPGLYAAGVTDPEWSAKDSAAHLCRLLTEQ